jgi:hypothetical protein
VLLCLADGALGYVGFALKRQQWVLISQYLVIILDSVLLILWGISLIKLNRKVANADQLMPNRGIFCLHGTVLVLYVVFNLAFIFGYSASLEVTGS